MSHNNSCAMYTFFVVILLLWPQLARSASERGASLLRRHYSELAANGPENFDASALASALQRDWDDLTHKSSQLKPQGNFNSMPAQDQVPETQAGAGLLRFHAKGLSKGYPTALAPGSLGKEQEDALMQSWRGSIPAPTSSGDACFGLASELCERCPAPMQVIAGADMEIDWVAEVDNLPAAVRDKYFPLSKMEEYRSAGKTGKRLQLEFKCPQMKEQCRQNFCKPICLDTVFDCSIAPVKKEGFIEVSSEYKADSSSPTSVVRSTIAAALCRQFKAKACTESKCCNPIVDTDDYSKSNFKLQTWLEDAALGGSDTYSGEANVALGPASPQWTLPPSGSSGDNSYSTRAGTGFGGIFGGPGMLLPHCNRFDPSSGVAGELGTEGKTRCDECKEALKGKITFRTMAARLKKEPIPLGQALRTCRGLRSWLRDSSSVEGRANSKEWNEYINEGPGPYKIASLETMCDQLSMKFSDNPDKPPLSDDMLVGTACSCMGCCRTVEAKAGETACPWPVLEDQLIAGILSKDEVEKENNAKKESHGAVRNRIKAFKDETAEETSIIAENLEDDGTYARTPRLPSWYASSKLSRYDYDLAGDNDAPNKK